MLLIEVRASVWVPLGALSADAASGARSVVRVATCAATGRAPLYLQTIADVVTAVSTSTAPWLCEA